MYEPQPYKACGFSGFADSGGEPFYVIRLNGISLRIVVPISSCTSDGKSVTFQELENSSYSIHG